MTNLLTIILMAPSQDQNPWISTIFLVAILVIFYFFMMRPQIKKQKEARTFRDSIAKGDKVLTIGGIHGKVVEVRDHDVLLEVDTNIKLRVEKSALIKDAESLPVQK
ncbi:MAG TPA: preprotein translocase subunit YajC [Bacteroidales bacterium]|nr:preprotein translocase subunit YajC [Bacteroidales bacterium]